MSRSLDVLSLQPYFGGSHAQFHRGWLSYSKHRWTTLELPARNWKWRMRHAAIHFSQQIHQFVDQGNRWDVIFATDMMNIAELKGLLRSDLRDIPIVLYFHENQFVYPNRFGQDRDRHFPFTNFISAIAADQIWFNSKFNLDSMTQELWNSSKHWPDFRPTEAIETLEAKSRIQAPGIEAPPLDLATVQAARDERASQGQPIHIVWAARWEHDKNPQRLFDAMKMLDEDGIAFRLSVIGQSFQTIPPVFDEIRSRFEKQIIRWGYQETRAEYWETLADADIFLSTATHEFFGLSAAEAIAIGTRPLLPNRLAYPELLSYCDGGDGGDRAVEGAGAAGVAEMVDAYLYEDDEDETSSQPASDPRGLVNAIKEIVHQRENQTLDSTTDLAKRIQAQLALEVRSAEMDNSLVEALG